MIESCWFWIKRYTTKHGAITSQAQLKEAWIKCIILHIKEVIILEGGNEYKEGRLKGQARNRVH
jgi:hypothetical protein